MSPSTAAIDSPGTRSALEQAVAALRSGGVIAYPTESVYGLGCDPSNQDAVEHLFALKRRPPERGVLLIGASFDQVAPYIDLEHLPAQARARVLATWPGPHTWVLPRNAATPEWIARGQAGIALRVTAHPLASALCDAFGAALVSTSANRHGHDPACTAEEVSRWFGAELALILPGLTGGLERPTPIRDAITGEYLRN